MTLPRLTAAGLVWLAYVAVLVAAAVEIAGR